MPYYLINAETDTNKATQKKKKFKCKKNEYNNREKNRKSTRASAPPLCGCLSVRTDAAIKIPQVAILFAAFVLQWSMLYMVKRRLEGTYQAPHMWRTVQIKIVKEIHNNQ